MLVAGRNGGTDESALLEEPWVLFQDLHGDHAAVVFGLFSAVGHGVIVAGISTHCKSVSKDIIAVDRIDPVEPYPTILDHRAKRIRHFRDIRQRHCDNSAVDADSAQVRGAYLEPVGFAGFEALGDVAVLEAAADAEPVAIILRHLDFVENGTGGAKVGHFVPGQLHEIGPLLHLSESAHCVGLVGHGHAYLIYAGEFTPADGILGCDAELHYPAAD